MLGVHRGRGDRGQGGEDDTWTFLKVTAAPWNLATGLTFPIHHKMLQEAKGIAPLLPKRGHLTAGDLKAVHPRVEEITCSTHQVCSWSLGTCALLGNLG